MYRESIETKRIRHTGYALVNKMQDKRKLYRLANMLINHLAQTSPKSIQTLANMLMSKSEMQELETQVKIWEKI